MHTLVGQILHALFFSPQGLSITVDSLSQRVYTGAFKTQVLSSTIKNYRNPVHRQFYNALIKCDLNPSDAQFYRALIKCDLNPSDALHFTER